MRGLKKIFIVALACVFMGSAGMFLKQSLEDRADAAAYEEAKKMVGISSLPEASGEDIPFPVQALSSVQETEEVPGSSQNTASEEIRQSDRYRDPYADCLRTMDLGALQAINSDCKGWILIANTTISYPLMQGTDNSYYLNHNYKKKANSAGAIFLDNRNATNLTDFNSIVYGHRMKNGTMFEPLKNYKSLSYWKKHPYIYITLPEGKTYQYTIFASYEASASGESYRTNFDGDMQAKQAFLDYAVGASSIKTAISVNAKDRILTLSTCTGHGYDTRLIIQAKLTSQDSFASEKTSETKTQDKEAGQTGMELKSKR